MGDIIYGVWGYLDYLDNLNCYLLEFGATVANMWIHIFQLVLIVINQGLNNVMNVIYTFGA